MDEEEAFFTHNVSRYLPALGVEGWVRGERDNEISRCFVTSDAAAYVWGQGTPVYRPLRFSTPIAQLACGGQHIAMLTTSGHVYTYGGNEVGQCGLGAEAADFVQEPTIVSSLLQNVVTSVTCGPAQTAAVVSPYEFYTWGYDSTTFNTAPSPTLFSHWSYIGDDMSLLQIHFGPQHTALLVETFDGKTGVWAWGQSSVGQLGNNKVESQQRMPKQILFQERDKDSSDEENGDNEEKKVVQLAGSESHMLALTEEGEVYAWGSNEDDHLCLSAGSSPVTSPALLSCLDEYHIRQVSCGVNFSTALTKEGEVIAWGKNDKSQLGKEEEQDSANKSYMPDRIVIPDLEASEDSEPVTVLCGDAHSAVISTDRIAFVWGCGANYCLNPVSDLNCLVPTPLAAQITTLSLGSNFTAAIFGTLECVTDVPQYVEKKRSKLPDLRTSQTALRGSAIARSRAGSLGRKAGSAIKKDEAIAIKVEEAEKKEEKKKGEEKKEEKKVEKKEEEKKKEDTTDGLKIEKSDSLLVTTSAPANTTPRGGRSRGVTVSTADDLKQKQSNLPPPIFNASITKDDSFLSTEKFKQEEENQSEIDKKKEKKKKRKSAMGFKLTPSSKKKDGFSPSASMKDLSPAPQTSPRPPPVKSSPSSPFLCASPNRRAVSPRSPRGSIQLSPRPRTPNSATTDEKVPGVKPPSPSTLPPPIITTASPRRAFGFKNEPPKKIGGLAGTHAQKRTLCPLGDMKMTRMSTANIIAVPAMVMRENAELSLNIKVVNCTGLSKYVESPYVICTSTPENYETSGFKTFPAKINKQSPVPSWNFDFQVPITTSMHNYHFFVEERKGKESKVLARAMIDVFSYQAMKDNVPYEVKVYDHDVCLNLLLETDGWTPRGIQPQETSETGEMSLKKIESIHGYLFFELSRVVKEEKDEKYKMIVKVSRCEKVDSKDLNGLSDPFVAVSYGRKKHKTQVEKKTLDPVFNEEFLFSVDVAQTSDLLRFEVFDWDFVGSNDFIGMAEVNLSIFSAWEEAQCLPLRPRSFYGYKKEEDMKKQLSSKQFSHSALPIKKGSPVVKKK